MKGLKCMHIGVVIIKARLCCLYAHCQVTQTLIWYLWRGWVRSDIAISDKYLWWRMEVPCCFTDHGGWPSSHSGIILSHISAVWPNLFYQINQLGLLRYLLHHYRWFKSFFHDHPSIRSCPVARLPLVLFALHILSWLIIPRGKQLLFIVITMIGNYCYLRQHCQVWGYTLFYKELLAHLGAHVQDVPQQHALNHYT